MFNCSTQKLRTGNHRGVGTARSKGGRPKAARKEHLEDASAIIQGHIFIDEALSTTQLYYLLRDIFPGLETRNVSYVCTPYQKTSSKYVGQR